MKKIINLLFILFIIFLIINPIWFRNSELIIGLGLLFLILDLIIIVFNKKNFKIDFWDILIILLPISYLLPYIFNKNVYLFKNSIFFIILEFIFSLTLLVMRRFVTIKKINILLTTILIISTMYFFIPFICQVWPKIMGLWGIFAYFGDTYLNSVDRFYGTFDYCNASALLFAISILISLFKLNNDDNYGYIYQFLFFINCLGFLITFSKMLTIGLVITLIFLVIYLVFYKQKKFFKIIILNISASLIPLLIMVGKYRDFLINLNIFIFLIWLVCSYIVYLLLYKLFILIYKKRLLYYFLVIMMIFVIGMMGLNVISIPLRINNVLNNNQVILTDFVLQKGVEYKIELELDIYDRSNVSFSLCRRFLEKLYPQEEIIDTKIENNIIRFSLIVSEAEYYYIKINNLNKKTDLKIKSMSINNENYLINSLLIPYAYIHQLDLIKYDKESVTHRLWYYIDSLHILSDYGFFIGQGKDTFAYYASSYDYNYLEKNPHSYLFQLWLDVGIYGVIYVILLVVGGFYWIIKERKVKNKIIWFSIFILCILVLPFDAIYNILFFRVLLIISFLLVCDNKIGKKRFNK